MNYSYDEEEHYEERINHFNITDLMKKHRGLRMFIMVKYNKGGPFKTAERFDYLFEYFKFECENIPMDDYIWDLLKNMDSKYFYNGPGQANLK